MEVTVDYERPKQPIRKATLTLTGDEVDQLKRLLVSTEFASVRPQDRRFGREVRALLQ